MIKDDILGYNKSIFEYCHYHTECNRHESHNQAHFLRKNNVYTIIPINEAVVGFHKSPIKYTLLVKIHVKQEKYLPVF